MLVYKVNVFELLKNKGYNTNIIRKNKIFTEAQLQSIRENHLLTHKALNKLCSLLECQPGDLLEYIPDKNI